MALNIGINVLETEGTATPAIAGAATSVAGFVIETARGPVDKPVLVTSFAQFVECFGGFGESLGAHLVKGFFDNGGRRAWINRVAGDGATAATGSHVVGTGNAARRLTFKAGLRGNAHEGAWAEGRRVLLTPTFATEAVSGQGADVKKDSAKLKSVDGFANGTPIVLLGEGGKRHAATVNRVDFADKTISWLPELAATGDFPATALKAVTATFDLQVLAPAQPGVDDEVIEAHQGLSVDPASPNNVVAALDARSRALGGVSSTLTADDAVTAREVIVLDDGEASDPSVGDFIGSESDHTGLRAFDPIDIQLLTTESSARNVVAAALDYCAQRGNCTFVGAVPQGAVSGGTAVDYGKECQGAKVYGALYGPWILVNDPLSRTANPTVWVPPNGHVMGVFARVESTRGIHKAPAGDEARVFGALDVEYRLSDAEHTDLVERGSVNGIRLVPGAGIVVDSSRSLSTDLRWRYVNVRLLFNYVKSSLRAGLRWVRQEPNKDTLWTAVNYGSVRPFLMGLWRQGAFGTGMPDEVFTITCDATNNPPDEVDKGNLSVAVTFYPSRPAETIVIKVGQQPSGATSAEA